MLVGLLLAGCREEIEYKGEEAEPSLYVYAVFDNDTLNYVFVGETSFFLDKPNTQCLDDAEVSIQINGGNITELIYDADTALYKCAEHFEAGDTLRLIVGHARLGTAEAIAVVPPDLTMTIKEVEYDVKGEVFGNYAIIEFATASCDEINNYYFNFYPGFEMEIYTYVYDDEHYNPETQEYTEDWAKIFFWCQYYTPGEFIAEEENVEENVDIWSLIYGDEFVAERFGMKENVMECKIEFDPQIYAIVDSTRSIIFMPELTIYSSEYVKYNQQSSKARNESSNPFVEPTQVQGNVKPTGDKRVFGFFAVIRNSRDSK